jgi:hypothetical protein
LEKRRGEGSRIKPLVISLADPMVLASQPSTQHIV